MKRRFLGPKSRFLLKTSQNIKKQPQCQKKSKKMKWLGAGTECNCLEWWSRWSPKLPPTWWTKTTQDVVRLKIVGRQSRPSINGRVVDASIFNLTTSCVVFVNHVGGHFGDHLDHHSKHLHSVPASITSFYFEFLSFVINFSHFGQFSFKKPDLGFKKAVPKKSGLAPGTTTYR